MKIINVVGARPNLMKIAPLMSAYAKCDAIDPLLVHTGQHYDENMSDPLFKKTYDSFRDSLAKSAGWLSKSEGAYSAQRNRVLGI